MADKNLQKENDVCEALLLDNQLCFPLYVCAKEIVNRYTPYLEKIGLTYTQYITMMVMWEEKKVVTKHLRERLYLDSGTLTPVLRRLEEKGLIEKKRSTKDARDLIVTITEKGEALKKEAVHVPEHMAMCLGNLIKDKTEAFRLKVLLDDLMGMFKQIKESEV